MGSPGKVAHVPRRLGRVIDELNLIEPLDAGAAVPTRHHQSNREAVVFGQLDAVHLRRQECACFLKLIERKYPVGASLVEIAIKLGMIIEPRDTNARRFGRGVYTLQNVTDRYTVPMSGADQSAQSTA